MPITPENDFKSNSTVNLSARTSPNLKHLDWLCGVLTSAVWQAGCQKNKAELCLLCPFTAPCLEKICQAGCQKSKAVLRSASLFYGSPLVCASVVWRVGCQKSEAELCPLCPFTASRLGTRLGILAENLFLFFK
ncbi:hypothetical protein DSO57_1023247 [Entomophthora muscae]|uniref:Uncharacterized protein n=1 Tax=Entomophthora muscae TaxID=34485 RepID=A0ACC2S4S8_9FUNG|nr:hypothetical protein DSO57_1023247 [Entomophthora muscae]